MEIVPRSLPQLSKQLRDQNSSQKSQKVRKKIKDFFFVFSVILVPELFKKVRETPGKNVHQVSSKSELGCPSYDRKTKKVRKSLEIPRKSLGILGFGDPGGGLGGPGGGF